MEATVQCMNACTDDTQTCSSQDVSMCNSQCVMAVSGLNAGCVQCILSKSAYLTGSGSGCVFQLASDSSCPAACPSSTASQYASDCMTACKLPSTCTNIQAVAQCQTMCVGGTNGLSHGCASCIISKSSYTMATGSTLCAFKLAKPQDCPNDCH
jgi:hypothetical protein